MGNEKKKLSPILVAVWIETNTDYSEADARYL